MVVPADQQLGKVGVLLNRADHHPAEITAKAHQNLLQEIVSERPLRLHALKLHGDGTGFCRTDPDGQHPGAFLLPQNHNWSVGGPVQTEMCHRDFDHGLTAQVPASQLARYSTCSAVSVSIAMPMLCSLSRAISWSTAGGSRCTDLLILP